MYTITVKEFIEQLLETFNYCSYDCFKEDDDTLENYIYNDLDDCSPLFLAKDGLNNMLNQKLISQQESNKLYDFGKKLMEIFASKLPRNAKTIRESQEWRDIFDLSIETKKILDNALNLLVQKN